ACCAALVADAAPGRRSEVEVTRRVEDADVAGEAREPEPVRAAVDRADATAVDRHALAAAVLLDVPSVRLEQVLLDRQVARSRRLRFGVRTEVADVRRQLVDEQVALLHDPLELV